MQVPSDRSLNAGDVLPTAKPDGTDTPQYRSRHRQICMILFHRFPGTKNQDPCDGSSVPIINTSAVFGTRTFIREYFSTPESIDRRAPNASTRIGVPMRTQPHRRRLNHQLSRGEEELPNSSIKVVAAAATAANGGRCCGFGDLRESPSPMSLEWIQ